MTTCPFTEFADDDNVTFNQASVSFDATAGNYRFTVTNGAGTEISSSTTVTGTGAIASAAGTLSGGFTDADASFEVASAGKAHGTCNRCRSWLHCRSYFPDG